jgi:hypothetical protein
MKDFQQRVVVEKLDLDGKLNLLKRFLVGDVFKSLHIREQDRMKRQVVAMQSYSDVLGERIDEFSK